MKFTRQELLHRIYSRKKNQQKIIFILHVFELFFVVFFLSASNLTHRMSKKKNEKK